MATIVTKRFCQLLVATTGQVCLPFDGWHDGLVHECDQPACYVLHNRLFSQIGDTDKVWVCAEHWDRIEAQKRMLDGS